MHWFLEREKLSIPVPSLAYSLPFNFISSDKYTWEDYFDQYEALLPTENILGYQQSEKETTPLVFEEVFQNVRDLLAEKTEKKKEVADILSIPSEVYRTQEELQTRATEACLHFIFRYAEKKQYVAEEYFAYSSLLTNKSTISTQKVQIIAHQEAARKSKDLVEFAKLYNDYNKKVIGIMRDIQFDIHIPTC
jgi:hypothetical protein